MKKLQISKKGRGKALQYLLWKKQLATFAAILCLMTMMPLTTRAQNVINTVNVSKHVETYVGYSTEATTMVYPKVELETPMTFDPYTTPLTFEAITDGDITFAYTLLLYHEQELTDIEYQINGGTWTTYTWNNPIAVVAGDKVAFRGNNASYFGNGTGYESHIASTADVYVYGNIMSLINSSDFATLTTLTGKDAFSHLFSTPGANPWDVVPNTTIKSHPTKDLMLPATTLTNMCYNSMFAGCQGLTRAPELPATEMTVACYASMFEGCTGLTEAPTLPTTMFSAYGMDPVTFEEYGSIDCYMMMFKDCTSLTEAPALPATTLVHGVYQNMFQGCTSLEKAPELPAPIVADYAYSYMFDGCTSLNYVKCLATEFEINPEFENTAEDNVMDWLNGVAATGTFVKSGIMEDWTLDDPSGIPVGWTMESVDVFITEGDWDVAANWSANAVPTDGSDVAIMANATVPNGCTANAGDITLYGSTLTIADGGQLIHTNAVNATLQKSINGFGNENTGWYTIASPITGNYSTEGLTVGTYDLYLYNEPTHYWWNAKGDSQNNQSFNTLSNGQGYLYANSVNQTLAFAGGTQATNATVTVPLSYTATTGSLQGYNLVGNPFTRNLTAGDVKLGDANLTSYYYVSNGSELSVTTIAERPIKPGEGFFVQASAATNLVFNPAIAKGGTYTKPAFIRIEVGNGQFMDYAYVQIGQGNTLRKMALNDNATKVYVMNNGMDYAAATIEAAEGVMPVNFKTAVNGTYTISVRTENLNLTYLHLIDNLTGNDVDLLATPNYTFEAKTSDYASRFRLVFITNEPDGPSTGS